MNTEFRVLKEETFSLKGGTIYTMLLRENGIFGVEVVNNKKTFGRKYTKDRPEADLLFDMTVDRLSQYKSIVDAEKAVENCFGFKSLNKLMFVLLMDDVVCSQVDIVIMKSKGKVKFVTHHEFGDDDSLSIYISEKITDKKPYGVLKGTVRGRDFKCELL